MTKRMLCLEAFALLAAGCSERVVDELSPQAPACGAPAPAPTMPLVHIGPDVDVEVPCGSQLPVAVASLAERGTRGFAWNPSLDGDYNVFSPRFPTVGISCPGSTTVVTVTVQPLPTATPGDTYDATVTISSPDDAFPSGSVKLHAKVVAAMFTIDPAEIELGDVDPAALPATVPVTFRSRSGAPVFLSVNHRQISPFTFGADFLSTSASAIAVDPLSIDPGTLGEHAAEFTWTSSMKGGPLAPACADVHTLKVHARVTPSDGGAPPDGR